MSEKWDPSAYKNTYHEDLMKRIEEKVKLHETHELTAPSSDDAQPRTAKVIDLAALLKQSIDSGGPRRAGAHGRAAKDKDVEKPPLRAVESARPARHTAKRKRA